MAAKHSRPARASTGAVKAGPLAVNYAALFQTPDGRVDVARVAQALHMTKGQLAETTGLGPSNLSKTARQTTMKVHNRVMEMLEIISRVRDWAGGETQALAWYRAQPIPALDGRTAEALVKSGKAAWVRDYLDHLALGGFA